MSITKWFISALILITVPALGTIQFLSSEAPITLKVIDGETGLEVDTYDYQLDKNLWLLSGIDPKYSRIYLNHSYDITRTTQSLVNLGPLVDGDYLIRVVGNSKQKSKRKYPFFSKHTKISRDNRYGYADFITRPGQESNNLSVTLHQVEPITFSGKISFPNEEFHHRKIRLLVESFNNYDNIFHESNHWYSPLFSQIVETDKKGNFSVTNAPPGNYRILIEDNELSNKWTQVTTNTFEITKDSNPLKIESRYTGGIQCKLEKLSEEIMSDGYLLLIYKDDTYIKLLLREAVYNNNGEYQIEPRYDNKSYLNIECVPIGEPKISIYETYPFLPEDNYENLLKNPPRLDKTITPIYTKNITIKKGKTAYVTIDYSPLKQ